MRYWIEYDGVGSEACIPVDSRFSLRHMIQQGLEHGERTKRYTCFRIIAGSGLLNAGPVTSVFKMIIKKDTPWEISSC